MGGFSVYGTDLTDRQLTAPAGSFPRLASGGKERVLRAGFPEKIVLGRRIPRRVIALALDRADGTPYAATKFTLHRWDGHRWRTVGLKGMNIYATITAVLAHRGMLWVGTGCYGVYRRLGKRWYRTSAGLPGEGLAHRRQFHETVTALEMSKKGTVYAGLHFRRGIFSFSPAGKSWRKEPLSAVPLRVCGLYHDGKRLSLHDGSRWRGLSGANGGFTGSPVVRTGSAVALRRRGRTVSLTRDWIPRRKSKIDPRVKGKRGLYFNPWRSRPAVLKQYIRLMKKKGYNALVIDVKDDFGRVLYSGKVPLARRVGAYVRRLDIKGIVALCRKENIWLIARMVTFKDPKLWRYAKNRYAIRDRYTGGVWNPESREKWVNPFLSAVRQYNIDLAGEVLALGFDEIQFDYIRFPTDGPIYRTAYPGRVDGAWKTDALENFLARARKELKGPISVDIYGFNAWYALGRWMGQDVSLYAAYADVISPMHYPSHFDRHFRAERGRIEQSYEILKHGTLRPRVLTGGRAVIRSWIQAFRWRAYGYGPAYWERQIKGIIAGGENSYLLWDAASRYGLLGRVRPFSVLKK